MCVVIQRCPRDRVPISTAKVDEMVRAGRIQEVAQYCESDVLNTYRLWLTYELFRGTITAEQLAFSEAQAREFIRTRKSENPHLRGAVGLSGTAHSPASHTSIIDRLLSPLRTQ